MENEVNTQIEGTQTGTEGTQQGRTFTQDDVNRIVQERLAKEKGRSGEDLEKRMAELDKRERKMNAVQKLRDNELSDYLVDALNMDTDEAFEKSMEILKKFKEESIKGSYEIVGRGNPIGVVTKFGSQNDDNDLRKAFEL